MNTDKLMELERKWRAEAYAGMEKYGPFRDSPGEIGELAQTIYAQAQTRMADADELAAALRAEQAVGDEQRARELVGGLMPVTHGMRRKGTDTIIGVVPNKIAAKPATREEYLAEYEEVPLYTFDQVLELGRALGTARQSGPANPVPASWIEAGGLMARICETKYGVGISYNCDEAITAFRDFFARQSEGMVLVPREPTPEMIAAGRDELGAYVEDTDDDYRRIYRRFIAAAPGGEGEGKV